MPVLPANLRPLRTSLACGLCCFACAGPPAVAQLLEFKGAEIRGRLDNIAADSLWRTGDQNSNGIIDLYEFPGVTVDINHTFLDAPGWGRLTYGGGSGSAELSTASILPGTGFADNIERDNAGRDGFDALGNPPPTVVYTPYDPDDLVPLPTAATEIGASAYALYGGAEVMRVCNLLAPPMTTIR
jgi:hypothetical protein